MLGRIPPRDRWGQRVHRLVGVGRPAGGRALPIEPTVGVGGTAVADKVYGGTLRFDQPDLCESCRCCTMVRGHGLREVYKRCSAGFSVPFRVAECKSYLHRNQMYPYEMEQIAWVLDLDRGKRVIGFLDPTKRREQQGGDCPMPTPIYPNDPLR